MTIASSVRSDRPRAERRPVIAAVQRALASRTAFIVVLTVFAVVGFAFAFTIHVPASAAPDERRHIGNILFYAARSWTAGPFVDQVDASQLWLGEVTRFPSYLYYYLMSFPAKAALGVGLSEAQTVVVLRCIDVIAATAGLMALRLMFKSLGVPTAIGLLATVTTAFTGRFAWQAATISYDGPSMAAFFVFAAVAARVVRGGGLRTLGWLAVTAMFAVMLKYSQAPLVAGGAVFALLLRYRAEGFSWLRHPVARTVAGFRARPWASGVLSLTGLVLFGLVVERLGVNVLVHHALNPACDELHTRSACMSFDIYRRNYIATRTHELAAAAGTLQPFHPLGFMTMWLSTYFRSLFFFWGPSMTWQPAASVVGFGVAATGAAVIVALTQTRRVLTTSGRWWLLVVAAAYVVVVFCFNAATFVNLQQSFAFSGRYLLPVMPMAVALVLIGLSEALQRLGGRFRTAAFWVVAGVAVALFLLYNPVSAFVPYASSPAWYSSWAIDVLPHWVTRADR